MKNKQELRGFDFHCHVDLHPDPVEMIAACEEEQVFTLAVTTIPRAWPQNRKWTEASQYVYAAPGLHPELIGEYYREVTLLEEYIKESRFVGEIGLDGRPQHRKSLTMQTEVFIRALISAQRFGGRVVSIHSRRATNEVLRCLEKYTTPDCVLPILHWFSGSIAISRKAVSLGCYFSINHNSLKHQTGRKLVQNLPEERLLTETDSPFTSVNKYKSHPMDVTLTTEQLAAVRNISLEKMRKILKANAQRVFEFADLNINV